MSVFGKDFLERVKSRVQKRTERSDGAQELIRRAQVAGHTGPLIVGPPRFTSNGSWRDDARWLAENFPQDFGEAKAAPGAQPSCGTGSSTNSSNSEPANEPTTSEPQPPTDVPESPQSAREVLSTPPPIQLPGTFWQSLLFGSRDALISAADATNAVRLVAHALSTDCNGAGFTETVRAGALRKVLEQRFGALQARAVMDSLWRRAAPTRDAPAPAGLSPGPLPLVRNQSRWVAELNESGGAEREWLTENGLWGG